MITINPLLYSFDDNKHRVESSNIEMVKYCHMTCTLIVKFSGGGIYLFSALPPSVYRSFCIAESKGSFFFKKIKGVYPYKKISHED